MKRHKLLQEKFTNSGRGVGSKTTVGKSHRRKIWLFYVPEINCDKATDYFFIYTQELLSHTSDCPERHTLREALEAMQVKYVVKTSMSELSVIDGITGVPLCRKTLIQNVSYFRDRFGVSDAGEGLTIFSPPSQYK